MDFSRKLILLIFTHLSKMDLCTLIFTNYSNEHFFSVRKKWYYENNKTNTSSFSHNFLILPDCLFLSSC